MRKSAAWVEYRLAAFGGVDAGATADGHERVKVSLTGELNGGVAFEEGCFEVVAGHEELLQCC